MFRMAKIMVLAALASSTALADSDDWDDYRGGYAREYYPVYPRPVERVYYREEIRYVPETIVEYVPAPPPPRYYAPPPQYYQSYDQRSPAGLLGGLVGGVMGYELGGGDPLAAGIGAAAGAWMGNGM